MASGFLDHIRDIEAEKAQVIKFNPFLTENDLVVEANGIGYTLEGQAKVLKVDKARRDAEAAGVPFVLPVAQVSVTELKAKTKKQQKEADKLAKELAEAEAREAGEQGESVEETTLPEPFPVDQPEVTKKASK